jgi:hypothetical protein
VSSLIDLPVVIVTTGNMLLILMLGLLRARHNNHQRGDGKSFVDHRHEEGKPFEWKQMDAASSLNEFIVDFRNASPTLPLTALPSPTGPQTIRPDPSEAYDPLPGGRFEPTTSSEGISIVPVGVILAGALIGLIALFCFVWLVARKILNNNTTKSIESTANNKRPPQKISEPVLVPETPIVNLAPAPVFVKGGGPITVQELREMENQLMHLDDEQSGSIMEEEDGHDAISHISLHSVSDAQHVITYRPRRPSIVVVAELHVSEPRVPVPNGSVSDDPPTGESTAALP